jgi:hypothetical protein
VCSRATPTTPTSPWGRPEIDVSSSRDKSDSPQEEKKSKMVALRRITKKVYAVPYKSRMDVKDALLNECSYPLVYYTINDYDSHDLYLEISEKEYLCVELSITIPSDPVKDPYQNATDLVANLTVAQNSDPFPLPQGHEKVTLFQGAVPYSSLVDIYQQKGISAQTQLRGGWGRLTEPSEGPSSRKEYIMMRGPMGKGQCQVAITKPPSAEPQRPPELKSSFLRVMTRVMNTIASGQDESQDQDAASPKSLVCSMTYVNIPWQSISCDLLEFQKKRKPVNL